MSNHYRAKNGRNENCLPRFFRKFLITAILYGLFSLLVIPWIAGCSGDKTDTLVVGMELAYPPFEMTDSKGKPTGVSPDLASALAKHLGKKLTIENIPFDGLIPALKTGKIDLIISSMTATDERRNSIDFSEPYIRTGLCMLVNAKAGIASAGEADRSGKTIAVKKGTTGHLWAAENIKKARVLILDKEAACVLEVAQGKADAFIYDQMSVYKHWERNKKSTKPLLDPFKQEFWAVGLRKGNDTLRKQVNEFLADFKDRQGFEKLADTYLKEQKEVFKRLGNPFLF